MGKESKRSFVARNTYWHPAIIAVGSVASATVIRAIIHAVLNEQIPYSTFYPAVMLTALSGGLYWGLLAIVLSAIAASFWLTPFWRPLISEPNDLVGMGMFLLVCALIVWLSNRVREHRREIERAAEQLQESLAREQAARKEAELANRSKDDFLATVSHELRTPLNSIFGWVQLIRQQRLTEKEVERAMESIERSARIQTQLVNDLLDLGRMGMGKVRLAVKPVSIAQIASAAAQIVLPAAKCKNVDVAVSTEESAGFVLGDPDRLHQIAWNLLSNSIKFTPSGGTVRVFAVDKDDHVELVVADNGEGIEPSLLPKVFDRFQQAKNARCKGGLGLGLAIVKELVELHGGSIDVSSGGKGHGARFTVTLPRHRAPVLVTTSGPGSSATPEARLVNALEGKQVLIVDDDSEARSLVQKMLRSHGAETISVGSAREAEEMLTRHHPHVLISDLAMPEKDGFELIQSIRYSEPATRSIPAVALSACTSDDDRSRAINSGFHVHLGKPVEPFELLETVIELVKKDNRT